MRSVLWLASSAVLSAAVIGARHGREVWIGMLGPLLVVVGTWILNERVYRASPERLTSVMVGAFAGKVAFFGGYIGLAIGVLGVQPMPFVLSFTAYFIVLNLIEALWLKRLFVSGHVEAQRGMGTR